MTPNIRLVTTSLVLGAIILWFSIQSLSTIPEFVLGTSQSVLRSTNFVCVHLDEAVLWETNEYAQDVFERIESTSTLSIDDVTIPSDNVFVSRPLETLTYKYDDAGRLIGSHGAGISICTPSTTLAHGAYTGIIMFSSGSDEMYEYEWVFNIAILGANTHYI